MYYISFSIKGNYSAGIFNFNLNGSFLNFFNRSVVARKRLNVFVFFDEARVLVPLIERVNPFVQDPLGPDQHRTSTVSWQAFSSATRSKVHPTCTINQRLSLFIELAKSTENIFLYFKCFLNCKNKSSRFKKPKRMSNDGLNQKTVAWGKTHRLF